MQAPPPVVIPQEEDMLILISPARAPGEIWVNYPGKGKCHLQFEELQIIKMSPEVPHVLRVGIPNVMFDAVPNMIENESTEFQALRAELAAIKAKVNTLSTPPAATVDVKAVAKEVLDELNRRTAS
jgi:hypothetical protein